MSAIDKILAFYSSPEYLARVKQNTQAQLAANPGSFQTIGGITFEVDASGNVIGAQSNAIDPLVEGARADRAGAQQTFIIDAPFLEGTASVAPASNPLAASATTTTDSVLETGNTTKTSGVPSLAATQGTQTGNTVLDRFIQDQDSGLTLASNSPSRIAYEDLTTRDFLSRATQEVGYGLELSEDTQEAIVTLATTERSAREQRQQGYLNAASPDTLRMLTSLNPFADVRIRQQQSGLNFISGEGSTSLDIDISSELGRGNGRSGGSLIGLSSGFESDTNSEDDPSRQSRRQRRRNLSANQVD